LKTETNSEIYGFCVIFFKFYFGDVSTPKTQLESYTVLVSSFAVQARLALFLSGQLRRVSSCQIVFEIRAWHCLAELPFILQVMLVIIVIILISPMKTSYCSNKQLKSRLMFSGFIVDRFSCEDLVVDNLRVW